MSDSFKNMLAELLKVSPDQITPASRIKADLGADSLDVLQLLMALEDTYHLTVPDEVLAGFETIQDVLDYLKTEGIEP